MKESRIFMDGPSTPENVAKLEFSSANTEQNPHTGRPHRARPPHHGPEIKPKLPPGISAEAKASWEEAGAKIKANLQHQLDSGASPNHPDQPTPLEFTRELRGIFPENLRNQIDGLKRTVSSVDTNPQDRPQSLNFDQVVAEGSIGRWKVSEVKNWGGSRIVELIDPTTGEKITFNDTGKKEYRALYGIPDPDAAVDLLSEGAYRAYVERIIAEGEEYADGAEETFDQQTYTAIRQTIQNSVHSVAGAGPNFSKEILTRLDARVRYYNTNYYANYEPEKFAGSFGHISKEMHKEILDNPQVKYAVDRFLDPDADGEGAYFRADGKGTPPRPDEATAANIIKVAISNHFGYGGPADSRVERAFRLAKEALNIFGVSADLEGVRDNANNAHIFDTPELNAEYFIGNLGNINANDNFQGNGANRMRRLMYLPVYLNQDTTLDKGRAGTLRKYCNLYITSAQKYDLAGVYKVKNTVQELLASAVDGKERNRLNQWASTISSAAEGYKQFAEKGGESILGNPLPGANEVKQGNKGATLPKALANYDKLGSGAYSHISGDRRRHAMTHWLEALLKWNGSPDSKQFNLLGWNKFIQEEVVIWARDTGRINDDNKEKIEKDLRLNAWGWQIWYDVRPDALKGGWAVIKWFYQQIYRFKG